MLSRLILPLIGIEEESNDDESDKEKNKWVGPFWGLVLRNENLLMMN